ncbi:hypothetical protein AAG570_011901 [Ranatra chinensis]|uniref:Polyprotein n=1 Tax=Ranatra chinensis TaxID=642074 RepID=A0ABD0YHN5_9HEMI
MLIRLVSSEIRADVATTFKTEIKEVVKKLKERYAGTQRPVARVAAKLIRMRRETGETPQHFAHRMDAELRSLKDRAMEEWGSAAATARIQCCTGIASEALILEMPETVRRQLRATPPSSMEAVLIAIDEDEDKVKAVREERGWTNVERGKRHRNPHRQSEKTEHAHKVWVGGLKTSARVARLKERLAAYSFTISHNKGKDNVVADCLSRMVNALDLVKRHAR